MTLELRNLAQDCLMKCLKCKKITKNSKFCSKSCANSFNNKNNPKRKKTKLCKECNKEFIFSDRTYCKKCFKKKFPTLLELNPTFKEIKSKRKYQKYSRIRDIARKYYTIRICEKCGYDKHIEICHIKPINSFKDSDRLSKINSKENLIALCPNCHWEFDNNILKI